MNSCCSPCNCKDLSYKVCFPHNLQLEYWDGFPIILEGECTKIYSVNTIVTLTIDSLAPKFVKLKFTINNVIYTYINNSVWDCFGDNILNLESTQIITESVDGDCSTKVVTDVEDEIGFPDEIVVNYFDGFDDITVLLLTTDNDISYRITGLLEGLVNSSIARVSCFAPEECPHPSVISPPSVFEYQAPPDLTLPISIINRWLDIVSNIQSTIRVVVVNPVGYSGSRFYGDFASQTSVNNSIVELRMFPKYEVVIEPGQQVYVRGLGVGFENPDTYTYYSARQILEFFRSYPSECFIIASAAIFGDIIYMDIFDNGSTHATILRQCMNYVTVPFSVPAGIECHCCPGTGSFPTETFPVGISDTINSALDLIGQEACVFRAFHQIGNLQCRSYGSYSVNATQSPCDNTDYLWVHNGVDVNWFDAISDIICQYGRICTNCSKSFSVDIDNTNCGKFFGGTYILSPVFTKNNCACSFQFIREDQDWISQIKLNENFSTITITNYKGDVFTYTGVGSCGMVDTTFTLENSDECCELPEEILVNAL